MPAAGSGYRLVSEYFAMPHKFMFVDVGGVQRARELMDDTFTVRFRFDDAPEVAGRVARDSVCTNCVPVRNLFRENANPIRVSPVVGEYLVRPQSTDPAHAEVQAVERVVSMRAGSADRREYRRFFSYAQDPDAVSYSLMRRQSGVVAGDADKTSLYLSLHVPQDAQPELVEERVAGEETLSIELSCTNGALPSKLSIGDISESSRTSPNTATFSNIVPVTPTIRPPLAGDLHWRLLSHLALSQQSLADAGALRAALELYNFRGQSEVGYANAVRVSSISEVASKPVTRLFQGAAVRAVRTTVTVDSRKFASEGEAFLFGALLDRVFASRLTLNSLHDLAVRMTPSQREYQWTPRLGARPVV